MNFAFLIKKIEESKEFKDFKKEHKDLYLAVGFFILDYEKVVNSIYTDEECIIKEFITSKSGTRTS